MKKSKSMIMGLIAIVAITISNSAIASDNTESPLGIRIGQSEDSINDSFKNLIDYQDGNTIYFKKFPKQYRDFDLNFIIISKNHGVCLISTIKDGLTNIKSSTEAIKLFSEISSDISTKYGKPTLRQEEFDNQTNLLIVRNEGKKLYAEWRSKLKTVPKIALSIRFDNELNKKGTASISYVGINYEECQKEEQIRRSSAL